MKTLSVYVDTSVFGGCGDEEFKTVSTRFFDEVRAGRFLVIISDLVSAELAQAPEGVQLVLASLHESCVSMVKFDEHCLRLRDTYVTEGIVGPSSRNDAGHVATATVHRADAIVSWNFKHIVHLEKIRLYNAVNLREGYGTIEVRSPQEVVHEDEDLRLR